MCPAWAGQEEGFERVHLGLENDCGPTQSTRTAGLDGCKEHPSVRARLSVQVPSRGEERRSCLLPWGCKFPLWGKPKAQRPPAHDQSLPGQHGHSHPPPLPQPLWVLHPACFCRKNSTGASSPAPQSPPALVLLRALSTSRVYVGPTAHGDSSVPPTLAARAVESLRSCTFAAVGPQGKEQRSHFHLQPHWEWRERAREKTSVCKTRQSAGNFPLAF